MRYAIIGVAALALLGGLAFAGYTIADDDDPRVLSGTELTIEDWIRCRDEANEMNRKVGASVKVLTVLPTQREDGEWTFNVGNKALNPGGEFYSCGR